MLKCLIVFAVFLMWTSSSPASEEADRQALSDAWGRYSELMDAGDYEGSLPEALRVLELAEELFPQDDKQLAVATFNYGGNLLYVNRRDEAAEILKLALMRFEDLYGKNDPKLIEVLLLMAVTSADRPNVRPQQQFLNRAYEIAAGNFDETSTEFADTLLDIASASYFRPPLAATGDSLRKALDIYRAQADPSALRIGSALTWLAVYHSRRGEYRESERFFRESLEVLDPSDEEVAGLRAEADSLLADLLDDLERRSDELAQLAELRKEYELDPESDKTLPIFRVAPVFPAAALRARKSGYVELRLTVDEQGFVINPEVIRFTGHESFQNAAIGAVLKFRYVPKEVEGQPVAIQDVRTRISFILED